MDRNLLTSRSFVYFSIAQLPPWWAPHSRAHAAASCSNACSKIQHGCITFSNTDIPGFLLTLKPSACYKYYFNATRTAVKTASKRKCMNSSIKDEP